MQVLLIAQSIAGYSLGDADWFRKAMGKKIPEVMLEEKGKYMKGTLENGFTKELGEKDIRVNAICPVLVSTEGLFEALNKDGAPGNKNLEAFINKFIEDNSALGRLPDVNDVAEMVYFLASPAAKAITGQCINVDCGVLPQ